MTAGVNTASGEWLATKLREVLGQVDRRAPLQRLIEIPAKPLRSLL